MCTENQNDIPVRTVVLQQNDEWIALCVDFSLQARGRQPEDAVDALETKISAHVKRAKEGETPLFPPMDKEALGHYQRAAENRLLASGPGHGHVEHRPLLLQTALTP